MKKYRKKTTSRLPARASAETRHESARSGAEVLYWHLVQNMLVQRERRNDLPELTPQRAQELFEAWRRGEMADVQLMWDQLEERDDTLMVVLNARLSALAEMPWAVVPDADAVGDDPQRQALAEEQKRVLMARLSVVENLEDALVHLGMADFRGVAALEITGDAARMRWEVIEPWNLCRPVRRGPWLYNAEASATPARLEAFVPGSVIIREAMPIDLPAMYLISSLHHSVHSWDGFLEVFGIPNIFMEMPPATPQDKALEFDAVVQRLIGEGRGTVPNGAKFHTVETSKDNSQSFEARYKVCREAIITLATGGLLTVGTAPNSGTLAGNAHSDSFSRLCAASARGISSAINRQFVRRVLAEAFPGQPMLVQFELAPEPVDDRKQMAELLSALNAAGWAPSAETVSEMMNFEVQRTQQPPTAPHTQVPPVMNRGDAPGFESPSGRFLRRGDSASEEEDSVESPAESEPPLNEGELEALRLLGGGLNPEQVAADAEYAAAALKEEFSGLTIDKGQLTNEETVTNSCNQYQHEAGCSNPDSVGSGGKSDSDISSEKDAKENEQQPSTLPTSEVTQDKARPIVGDYKENRMRDAQAHAKSVLPREVKTPLPDAPEVAMNGSDIKEMLNTKAVFSSVRNGVSPGVHEEAVLRTPELLPKAKEVSRRAGGKKDKVVIKDGKEVVKEDPIAEIIEMDAAFHARDGHAYTARYSVQKYKKPNMKPKVYFMYCRK